jgi:hypothetical protein
MAKKTKSRKGAVSGGRGKVVVRARGRQAKKAELCLERSGKILIGFKDVSVTRLPKSISPVAVFKD